MPHPRLEAVKKGDVIRVSSRVQPKSIQKWSVVVGAREFPVKQILMEAANSVQSPAARVTPADFIAHYAVRKLKSLGFTVRYSG
jgi:hypothetical protein